MEDEKLTTSDKIIAILNLAIIILEIAIIVAVLTR